jgi:hypothetical protein
MAESRCEILHGKQVFDRKDGLSEPQQQDEDNIDDQYVDNHLQGHLKVIADIFAPATTHMPLLIENLFCCRPSAGVIGTVRVHVADECIIDPGDGFPASVAVFPGDAVSRPEEFKGMGFAAFGTAAFYCPAAGVFGCRGGANTAIHAGGTLRKYFHCIV